MPLWGSVAGPHYDASFYTHYLRHRSANAPSSSASSDVPQLCQARAKEQAEDLVALEPEYEVDEVAVVVFVS